MASNTKLGFALILIILGAFAFVVYKKSEDLKQQQASQQEDPNGAEGEQTFGDGGEPFGTGEDGAHHHQHSHASTETPGAHADHDDAFLDSQKDAFADVQNEPSVDQAEAGKPGLLPGKEEMTFDEQQPKHLVRTDLRQTVQQSPAFGDELMAQNDPEPFESDTSRQKGNKGTAGTASSKSKPSSAGQDSFGTADSFESDTPRKKSSKQAAPQEDFGDPFGADQPSEKEEDLFEGDVKEPPRQAANPRQAPVQPAGRQPASDAFGDDIDNFARDQEPSNRPPAPIKPAPADDWGQNETFEAQNREPQQFENFEQHETPARHHRKSSDDFVNDSPPAFESRRPSQSQKFTRDDGFIDSPGQGFLPDASNQETYVIQTKDNFWSISRKKYGTARYFQLLAELNKDVAPDPQQLQPGTKIVTPSKQFLEEHYSEILAGRTTAQQVSAEDLGGSAGSAGSGGFFYDEDDQPRYRVGRDDTLSEIAQRHLGRAARWIQIYELNRDKLSSPNDLRVGTELILPSDAAEGTLVRAVHESR